MLAYDKKTGKVRDSDAVDFVDKLIELKEVKGHWEVIEYLVQYWEITSPEEAEGMMIRIDDVKETRIDQKHGKTPDKNMDRRLIMIMPMHLQHLIRKIYPPEELPFTKTFMREFAERFPQFKIPEKI